MLPGKGNGRKYVKEKWIKVPGIGNDWEYVAEK
jgi:hypothetical protein